MQLLCPESACVEQSSQEAAWPGAAGRSQAQAWLPGLCPEHTAGWEPSTRAREMLML